MHYTVKITPHAISQLQEITAYISKVLLAPETAIAWADTIEQEIAGLDVMPARFPLTDTEPWRSKGIHKMIVKNYIVYYLIDEENETVWVTAVVYARRDQINALKELPL